ncbi:DctP family TRAP transporter solute-binding subunit [Thorsellia anophelis]|uniref:Tripartite ATP-independent transporter solute receptor, DctP family n=1 Tax=Thorsellia anophelis DSM 18579 TaxID=1123402 RepID=A0A1I0B728_9GAMM|nr:DctP family TRAP transporter solute-binding subunit [Thorsellia anophelis]SET02599.1 tripartite ATP-independent transporter solute receptor, DctP family [Thorsellia anophelis DSM 18579]
MKKIVMGLTLTASLMIVMTASAETVIKLAHAAPETDLQQNLSLFFKKEVESRSNGSLKVNIYPQGQLGNDKQMIDGARSGIIDISMVGLNNYSGFLPEATVFELPFMFTSREDAYKALDGEAGTFLLEKMEGIGLKGLGYPENGFRNITNNKHPIKNPEDLNGLQMRVNNSKALNDMFNMLGANPQQIPVAELYTALETGVVDSQDHPIGVTYSFRFNEVQKYLSLTQHAYSPLVLTFNMKKFDALTSEEQDIIREVAKEAVALQRNLSKDKEEQMISELESGGMSVNRDVNSQAFQEAVKPVWDNYIKEYGDDFIKKIQATK